MSNFHIHILVGVLTWVALAITEIKANLRGLDVGNKHVVIHIYEMFACTMFGWFTLTCVTLQVLTNKDLRSIFMKAWF